MDIASVQVMLVARHYMFCATLRSRLEALEEAPGVYVVIADQDVPQALAVRVVSEPSLRTDILGFLQRPEIASLYPRILACRVIERAPGEDFHLHQAQLVLERASVLEELRRLR